MRVGYVDLALANGDLFDEGFSDLAAVVQGHGRPTLMECGRLVDDIIGGELVDFEKVNFGFELWQFGAQLVQAFFCGFVELAEALAGDLALKVEAMRPGHLVPHLLDFIAVDFKGGGLFIEIAVGILQNWRPTPVSLLPEKELQFVHLRMFLPNPRWESCYSTCGQKYLGLPARLYHLRAARAVGEAAEEMHRRLARLLPRLQLLFDDLVDLIPKVFRDDGFALGFAPFAFGLRFGAPTAGLTLGIEYIDALSTGFIQDAKDGCVPPD